MLSNSQHQLNNTIEFFSTETRFRNQISTNTAAKYTIQNRSLSTPQNIYPHHKTQNSVWHRPVGSSIGVSIKSCMYLQGSCANNALALLETTYENCYDKEECPPSTIAIILIQYTELLTFVYTLNSTC